MSALYFYLLILVHPYLAMWWKTFEKADRKSWEALIPLYNYFVAFKIGAQKPWWSLLMFIPGIHLVMLAVANVSLIRRFGYFSLGDTLQGIFFPYIIFFKIAKSEDKLLPETNWANTKEMGDREWGDHVVLFLCLPVIGHVIAVGLDMVTRHKPGNKSKVKEWGDSLLFALVAASIIRTYVFEPFQIPTGSMEKTLLVGDFLFVNKLAYGPKVPVTPLSYPLVHNTVPKINIKSYTQLEKLDYLRLPGFSEVNRNDVVVFNYPSGDTAVYDPRMPNGLMGHDYHGVVIREARLYWERENNIQANLQKAARQYSSAKMDSLKKITILQNEDSLANVYANEGYQKYQIKFFAEFIPRLEEYKSKARKYLAEEKKAYDPSTGGIIEHYGVIYRPVDKRENYIKRCVGIPGDTLEIKESVLYVNGEKAFVAENQNLKYIVSNFSRLNPNRMDEVYDLEDTRGDYYTDRNTGEFVMHLTKTQLKELKKRNPEAVFTIDLEPQYTDENRTPNAMDFVSNLDKFPKDLYVNNTTTDFTKFVVPKKGTTVKLSTENIAWYRRIITAYELHTLKETKDGIFIDGKKVNSYTFGMDYYWLMGDNRYNSADSRVWGFVPEDHVVGKASLVWFSSSPYKGFRTERFFTWIK